MFKKKLCLVTVLLICLNAISVLSLPAFRQEITELLNQMLKDYDRRLRPNFNESPAKIGINMRILSISSISELDMEFTLDMYFRQVWHDERLKFNLSSGIQKLVVGKEILDQIWVPDTYFVNEKESSFHDATTRNTFVRILNTGDIETSVRLTLTLSCPMSLENFPMDTQVCYIIMESYAYPKEDITYFWSYGAKSVQIAEDILMPQHRLINHKLITHNGHYMTGSYTQMLVKISFARLTGFYLTQYFIPAALIVLVSFLALWIDRSATVERVALGFTMILTVTTLMSSANNSLPKVSYIKAIDIYLAVCFGFVFSVLLEFIVGGYVGKRLNRKRKIEMAILKSLDFEMAQRNNVNCGKPRENYNYFGVNATRMDIFSRFAFPFAFAVFQFIYWTYYILINAKNVQSREWKSENDTILNASPFKEN